MTADIELLPLPAETEGNPWIGYKLWDVRKLQSYARAVAEHNVAARDAQIAQLEKANEQLHAHGERMHAEIEELRAEVGTATRMHAITREHLETAEARAKRLAEEIDWIKLQSEDDRMFAEIEAAAKAGFHRHRTSCRGQVLTRADNYESHLVWATLEWAKRTNGAEQHAERLAEALRDALEVVRGSLQNAYQNAGQECCGRGVMQECCGEPEPVWVPEDQAVMDKLAPIERMLSSALRDHGHRGVE